MRIDRIDHFVLTVADIDATIAFYTTILGMTAVVFGGDRKALRFGDSRINLHPTDEKGGPKAHRPTPGSADVCLVVGDPIEAVIAELTGAGVPIEVGPVEREGARGQMTSVYLRDPDDNLIELSNYL